MADKGDHEAGKVADAREYLPGWLGYLARLGEVVDRRPWVPPASAAAGVAVAGVLFSLGSLGWGLVAALVLLLSYTPEGAVAWWRRERDKLELSALEDQILQTSDALVPLARMVAALAEKERVERGAEFGRIYEKAVGACSLHFKDRENVRACLFILSDDLLRMMPEAYNGRRDEPGPFEKGTSRGDKAFQVLRERVPVWVNDLGDEQPATWDGTGRGYRTFITCPVYDTTGGYGLLNVDAPAPGTFSRSDARFLEVTASVVAIACALSVTVSDAD